MEVFGRKGGSHVRGRLAFEVKFVKTKIDRTKQTYQSKGAGYFDVEICDDSEILKGLTGQPQEVPEGDVAGAFPGAEIAFQDAVAHPWRATHNAQRNLGCVTVLSPT